ncbi:adenosylcobinamide-phosphate synthase CbiB [Thalassococcus sp. S3]|uniref:adenosylcobinamide-phosphate synthase CbiB n=1 Tax=Thalassococcus sp. S3 TaxID=2017482 RepID=UPI0010245BFA|nr:adenosylcobinamide-phosphate synthase CbiB [Thalassococcus sp. S3]QBF29987.1 adenosylcobinamide-phosphate synthase [Thalassococcus sp. S3]
MTAALVLALALLLDALLGEPDWLWSRVPHPAVLMGRAVSSLDRALNAGASRKRNGILAVVILVCGAALIGWALGQLGLVVEVVAAAILLAHRSLVDHVGDVARGLRQSVEAGRASVALIVSRETAQMTEPDVARAAIESAAENLSDGVIAPAFWFLVAGLPGLVVYKAVNTADSMIGYRTARYAEFGWAAARLDDLLNLIPARLTALLFMFVTGGWKGWRGIVADARQHRSPNAGWPEAAMARGLGIALAGPRWYDGGLRDLHWVNGTGRTGIGADEIDAAIQLLWRVWGAGLVLVIVIGIL